MKWAKVIDHTRCIGCHACSTACKSENLVPLGVNRTYVKYVEVGTFPSVRRVFQVTRCNQCDHPPCVTACPTAAMFRRSDGIVDFDKSVCIGCKACIAACPYDAIFMNPEDHSAEKCNFCAHRLELGLEPACVVVCPTEAILVGDMADPASKVGRIIGTEPVAVRRPEKGTRPKLFYKGAHEATLDPLAAERPPGGLFLWSEQGTAPGTVTSGHPEAANQSAPARLAYDVPRQAPWDWRVSLYTWTKGIASGAYLVPLALLLVGQLDPASPLWVWAAPVVGGLFLAATGALLIADLEHPTRFYLIFLRPQWRSWLVRGAVVITAYAAVLGLHALTALMGWPRARAWLSFPGLPLAVLTAIYTAYLFGQSKGRDLWQNPLLPAHFGVQSLLAGSAFLALVATIAEPARVSVLLWSMTAANVVHLLLAWSEVTSAHATEHARLAAREMTDGRYRRFFWGGMALNTIAVLAPWLGTTAAALALFGLLAYEHAYVQAGQSVAQA